MERRARTGICERIRLLLLRRAGEDLPGRDRVHENAARTVVDRDLAGQIDDAPFAGGIGDVPGWANHAVLRGDVDNATANLAERLLLEHLRDCPLAAEKNPAKVDAEDRIP